MQAVLPVALHQFSIRLRTRVPRAARLLTMPSARPPTTPRPWLLPHPWSGWTSTADDDSATLHSRLERAARRAARPGAAPNARVLRRPLDFRILARLAAELGLDLTVATADVERQRLAREFGFHVCTPPRGPRWRAGADRPGALVAVAALAVAAAACRARRSPFVPPWPPSPGRPSWPSTWAGRRGPGARAVGRQPLMVSFELEQTRATSGRESVGHTPAKGYVTLHDRRPYVPPRGPSRSSSRRRPRGGKHVPGASGLAGLLGHNPSGRPASPPARVPSHHRPPSRRPRRARDTAGHERARQ